MLKINDSKDIEVIEIGIKDGTYQIPLAKYLPYKAIKKLRTGNDIDAVMEILSKYIPMEVLDELTMDSIKQIIEAWSEASKDDTDDNLGK